MLVECEGGLSNVQTFQLVFGNPFLTHMANPLFLLAFTIRFDRHDEIGVSNNVLQFFLNN